MPDLSERLAGSHSDRMCVLLARDARQQYTLSRVTKYTANLSVHALALSSYISLLCNQTVSADTHSTTLEQHRPRGTLVESGS